MRNTKRITGMTKIKSNSYIDVLGSIRNGAIVLLASAFLLVGCNKDNGSVVEPVTKTSLTASMEQQGGDTKTSLEQLTNNVLWTKDDKISVFWDDDLDTNQEFSLSGEGGFQSGVFTGNGGADATNCYVFYPYDGDTGMMVDEDLTAISFRLPPYQSYKAGGFDSGMNPMVAYGAKTSKLSFKNLCGLLVINLKRTEGVSTKISQITVRSDNQKLSGEAYVQIPYTENESGVAVPKIVMGEDAFNSVSLFVNDAVDLINGDATFYIVVPPIAVSDVNKLTVEVISGGREYAKSTNNNLASVSRSKIRSMQALPLSSLTVTKYEEVSGVSLGEAIAVNLGNCYTVFAPVNCGYDPTNYKYGKLYQWGRKYGQGYGNASAASPFDDATFPSATASPVTLINGTVAATEGQANDKKNVFYKASPDWCNNPNRELWDFPKATYDPCPQGWRVPTRLELSALINKGTHKIVSPTLVIVNGQKGHWFSGSATYNAGMSGAVFFPAAGYRSFEGAACLRGDDGRYWSSSSDSNNSCFLNFASNNASVSIEGFRVSGNSVRCVKE